MPGLSKEQALRVLTKLQEPGFVPFLKIACCLVDVSPVEAEAAYERGLSGAGSELEKTFATAIERIKAKFIVSALATINDPNLRKADEPRARQLMNILGKLDRTTFSSAMPKPRPLVAIPEAQREPNVGSEADALSLSKALEALERQ